METDKLLKANELELAMKSNFHGLKIENSLSEALNTGSLYVRADLTTVYSDIQGKLNPVQSYEISIEPRERIYCQTLEKVSFSSNNYGVLLPRVWSSINNIDLIPGAIDPGFSGRPWLIITNNSNQIAFLKSTDFIGKLLIWEGQPSQHDKDLTQYGWRQNREDIKRHLDILYGKKRAYKIKISRFSNYLFWFGVCILTLGGIGWCIQLIYTGKYAESSALFVGLLAFIGLVIGLKVKPK